MPAASARTVDRRRALRAHFLSRARVRAVNADAEPRRPASRRLSRRSADALDVERRQPDARGDRRGRPQPRLRVERRHRSLGRAADRERPVAGALRGAAGRDRSAEPRRRRRFRLLAGVEANIRADGTVDIEPAIGRCSTSSSPRRTPLRDRPPTRRRGCWRRWRRRGSTCSAIRADACSARAPASPRTGRASSPRRRRRRRHRDRRRSVAAGRRLRPGRAARSPPAACSRSTPTPTPSPGATPRSRIAHARLAGIDADRVVNTWPLDRLLRWASAANDSGVVSEPLRSR